MRVGQGPVEPHKLDRPGATPGPATLLSSRDHAGKSPGSTPGRTSGKEIWAAGPTGRRLACNQEIGVQFPGGPLIDEYFSSMVKRKSFLASNEEVRVRLLVELLKSHGFRGVAVAARLAVNQEAWVRLPSDTPVDRFTRMCSWESRQPPKLVHGVRILALVLNSN